MNAITSTHVSRIRRASGHSTWCGTLESGVGNRGLCHRLRDNPHHPCLPVQNSSSSRLNAGEEMEKAQLMCSILPQRS